MYRAGLGVVVVGLWAGCSTAPPEVVCREASMEAAQQCIVDVSAAHAACLEGGDALCTADDSTVTAALSAAEAQVLEACMADETLSLPVAEHSARLASSCATQADSLAWRTFGGPHAAVWEDASESEKTCLTTAHEAGAQLISDELQLLVEASSDGLDVPAATALRADPRSTTRQEVTTACPILSDLIAVDVNAYVDNTGTQADCLTSMAHPSFDVPSCGPSAATFDAPRGEWTEVIVDSATWGTQCADGTDYAFWVKLAPEGSPLDRVVVALQGGGVCVFEDDCASRFQFAPQLLNAQGLDDVPFGGGVTSSNPEVSPFADWTILYAPYCTQDVFAGGGVIESFENLDVPRFGSVNLRTAVSMTRDVIWREMDAAGEGYNPNDVVALFGGFSAGGYGTLYNYHWMIDDLQWRQTTAYPDGGLAVDNGELLGVGSLGLLKIPAWGMKNYLPPYCFDGPCSGGQIILEALSERVQPGIAQNMLLLGNQHDSTQAGDAYFSNDADFINATRQMYCDTRDLPGVFWYLTSNAEESVHVVSIRDDYWLGEVAGMVMSDFFVQATEQPDMLASYIEEGDFVDAIPGVEPIPCQLP